MMFGTGHDFTNFGIATDVTWINTQTVCSRFSNCQCNLMIKMHISNQRYTHLFTNLTKRFNCLHRRSRDAHEISTSINAAFNLSDCCGYITSICIGHALHTNRCIAANRDITDIDLFGRTASNRR